MYLTSELIAARPVFKAVAPGPKGLFAGPIKPIVKMGFICFGAAKAWRKWRKGTPASTILGEKIAEKAIAKAVKVPQAKVVWSLKHVAGMQKDVLRKNGMGGRSWLIEPGRYDLVVVFHDANHAGPHIDVHIGRLSVIYRVKSDLYSQLKYNRDGILTQDSQDMLLAHLKAEIAQSARTPQNLDHSKFNARAAWVNGDINGTSYGSGRTRQVLLESEVDIYKAHRDGPIEFFAPKLNPFRGMYLYQIYPGTTTRAPILIWGNRTNQPPVFEDRLHLKLIQPEDIDKLPMLVDVNTTTAKYDGSSTYLVIGPKGTTAWSPRTSVRTGEAIEYTHKLNGVAGIHSEQTIIAMGEVLFTTKGKYPWSERAYVPQSVGSGILNSNALLPKGYQPEIRLYRVDRFDGKNVSDTPFWENRSYQAQTAKLDPKRLKVVELMSSDEALARGFEGVVAAPIDKGIKEGIKIKYWSDANDWRIDEIAFFPGEKGGLAGVVWCTSLESNKRFKLGSGQIGNRDLCEDMMTHPELYVGTVIKVHSKQGHDGRAAKAIAFHDDKGFAPV